MSCRSLKKHNAFLRILFFVGIAFLPFIISAQGVRGTVIDQDGNPMPYTTIFVAETGSGSVTNLDGAYDLRLAPGTYRVNFQFLGYKNEQIVVNVGDEVIIRDVVLQKQTYLLQAAEIDGGVEDPAYKIMRKAIAKSNYHRQQVDHYTCEVYLKGGGRIVDAPRLLRKAMIEEGLDTSATFITESVSKITYNRPGEYKEQVISVRSVGDNRNTEPMNYINTSFYEPVVAGAVSPFSPKAFGYYRFKYIRSFSDRGYQVNEIQVIPRRKGTDTYTGRVFVIEDLWAIHSLELSILSQGITVDIFQAFAPVQANVWMPISHKYDGRGKILGFKFEFQYLAAVSDYEVVMNQSLAEDIVILDEVTEQEEIEARDDEPLVSVSVDQKLMEGGELTRKEMRQLMREYEKQERKKKDEPQVMRSREFSIDSTAYELDSAYWELRRPVVLTEREIRGYSVQDSTAMEAKKRVEGDTLGSAKFKPLDLILGSTYNLGNDNYLKIRNALFSLRFNTVDGWNFKYGLSFYKRIDENKRFEISPVFRYGFARDKGMGKITTRYDYGAGLKKGSSISLSGGYYYNQFNRDNPISTLSNSISSLFTKKHFMKVYDTKFVETKWNHRIRHNLYFKPEVHLAERIETFNHTDFWLFKNSSRQYTDNTPESLMMPDSHFGRTRAFRTQLGLSWLPGAKYYKNKDVYTLMGQPPVIDFTYEKAISGIMDSKPDYDLVKIAAQYGLSLNRLGMLNLRNETGLFLRSDNMDFIDYAHFMGNQTIFTRMSQMSGYSLAPYYLFSTSDGYSSTYVNLELRQFLLTNFTLLRILGVKENINFNHLVTANSSQYMEVGYSIENLFRFIRLDVTSGFLNGKYSDFRVQIGISSDLIKIEK